MFWKRIAAVSLLAVAMVATSTAKAATTWEAYVYNPVASLPSVKAVQRFMDEVKEKTNGDLLMTLHLGDSLPIKADGITAAVGYNIVKF